MFLPFCLLLCSGPSSPHRHPACQSAQSACFYRMLLRAYLYRHTFGQNRQTSGGREEGWKGQRNSSRGLWRGSIHTTFRDWALPLRKEISKHDASTKWSSWLYWLKKKIQVLCDHCVLTPDLATSVFKQYTSPYAVVFTAGVRRVSFARLPTRFPCICATSEAAQLSHILYFFRRSLCSRRSHLHW